MPHVAMHAFLLRTAVRHLSKHDLFRVKRLSQTFWCMAPDPPDPGHREEGLVIEPVAAGLAWEVPTDCFDFLPHLIPGQRHKNSRITNVTVVFRDFIFKNEVIAKGIVG